MINEDKLIEVMNDIVIIRNSYLREADKYEKLLASLESLRTWVHGTPPEKFEEMIDERILRWETERL